MPTAWSPRSRNALLKSIEEPPDRTVVILLTDRPDALLATIRSRCQHVDFGVRAAGALRGDRRRARCVRGRRARASTAGPPPRSNSSRRSRRRSTESGAAAEAEAAAELEQLEPTSRHAGYPPRTAAALRRRLADRHRQELRRAKVDALIEGIGAIEQGYLDVLADAPDAVPVDADRACRRDRCVPRRAPGRRVQPERRFAAAAPRVAAACRRLTRQEVRMAEGPSVHCRTPPG